MPRPRQGAGDGGTPETIHRPWGRPWRRSPIHGLCDNPPPGREGDIDPKKCLRCGGANLEPGWVQSTGKIYFRPDNTKFMTLRTADVEVNGNFCLDCGTVELVGDAEKCRRLVERARAH